MMNGQFRAGVTSVIFIIVAAFWTPAWTADLPQPRYGSLKDVYVEAPPPATRECYMRTDVGYSYSEEPDGYSAGLMTDEDLDDGFFFEGGAGCALGRGFRGEIVAGYREEKDYSGHPEVNPVDPFTTNIQSYTLMANLYYDFQGHGKFVPYVGAGLEFAYHDMDDVYCNPASGPCTPSEPIIGDENLSFAWSVMVGFGYQISDRAVFDLAYRYIDLGDANSGPVTSDNNFHAPLELDDLTSHEIKAGIRYSFGGGTSYSSHAW